MSTQLKKGTLELCVLGALSRTDRYGYELVEIISKHIDISEGTIYPLLRRCMNDGLFDSYLKESDQGPPRKYYKLTDRGRAIYREQRQEWDSFSASMNKLLEEVDQT